MYSILKPIPSNYLRPLITNNFNKIKKKSSFLKRILVFLCVKIWYIFLVLFVDVDLLLYRLFTQLLSQSTSSLSQLLVFMLVHLQTTLSKYTGQFEFFYNFTACWLSHRWLWRSRYRKRTKARYMFRYTCNRHCVLGYLKTSN